MKSCLEERKFFLMLMTEIITNKARQLHQANLHNTKGEMK